MAKLRGAKKAAFLKRMARGRAKARRSTGRGPVRRAKRGKTVRRKVSYSGHLTPSKKRPGSVRIRLRQNPLSALLVNPGGALVPYGYKFPAKKRRRKARKTTVGGSMARKRRRRVSRAKSPRRRRTSRTLTRSVRVPKRRAKRYFRSRKHKRTLYLNPGKRRRRSIRRRRNPGGFGGLLKMAFIPYATGVVTAGVAAMLDTGLAKWPVIRQVVKVAGVLGIASFLGRRHPLVAAASIGAIGASQGYPLITRLAGGMVARTPAEAITGMGEMTDTYPEMGALLQGGLGALLQGMDGPSNVDDVAVRYEEALANMSGDDDDDA